MAFFFRAAEDLLVHAMTHYDPETDRRVTTRKQHNNQLVSMSNKIGTDGDGRTDGQEQEQDRTTKQMTVVTGVVIVKCYDHIIFNFISLCFGNIKQSYDL